MTTFLSPRPWRRAAGMAAVAAVTAGLAALPACTDHTASATPAAAAASAASAPSTHTSIAMARGRIEVQGGLLELSPPQDGQVDTLAVQEGQQVTRGQLLLRLGGAAAQAEAGVAQAELRLAEERVRSRAQALPTLRRAVDRFEQAAAAGAAEPRRAEEAAQALRDGESGWAVSRAEADVARQKLAHLHVQQRQLELRAPEDGTVVRVATQVGQRLLAAAGSPAAVTLLPHRPLQVRAELNESYAAAVRPGMRATVTTDGDVPAVALPAARVVRMSPVLGTARLQDDAQRGPQRIVECVLEFDQPPALARPGQTVRVAFQP